MDCITYNEDHRVAVCWRCGTCLGSLETAWARYLREMLHRLMD